MIPLAPARPRLAQLNLRDFEDPGPDVERLVEGLNTSVDAIHRVMGGAVTGQDVRSLRIAKFSVTVPSPWVAPTLGNSWVNYGLTTTPARFMKHPTGVVELQGAIKSGVVGLPAFALPLGFRPSADLHFASSSNGAYGAFYITNAGFVVPFIGSNVYFFLDCQFLPMEATPRPLSCWPVSVPVPMTEPPLGVIAIAAKNKGAGDRAISSDPMCVLPSWRFVRSGRGAAVQVLDIPGLAYDSAHEVTLLILGG